MKLQDNEGKEIMTESVKIQHHCLACGSELSGPLFEISNMPCGAQAMPDAQGLAEDCGIDLQLSRCPECGLVQFDCEPVPYYRDAIRVVGLSETMKELRRADYRLLTGKYGKKAGYAENAGSRSTDIQPMKWLECGCSNGDFLAVLAEPEFAGSGGISIYGTEAGAAGLAEARGKLCAGSASVMPVPEDHLMQWFPDREDLDIPGAPFDVFLSFNFLEHQPDPVTMLKCLRRNLADDGIGLITVPSFEYIIGEGRYYELVRDHIANYDMESLTALCRMNGFEVLEKDFIGIGDTLRVVVRKSGGCMIEEAAAADAEDGNADADANADGRSCLSCRDEAALRQTADIGILKEDYLRMRSEISEYVNRLRQSGRKAALWGAGHQGFTIAATTEFCSFISYIIDSSEKKQGRFAPASHIRIVSPEEYLKDPVDVIIISAPGYVKEIEASIRKRYQGTAAGVPAICSILDLREH